MAFELLKQKMQLHLKEYKVPKERKAFLNMEEAIGRMATVIYRTWLPKGEAIARKKMAEFLLKKTGK